MAKKSSRSGSKKHYPVQRKITCSLALPAGAGTTFGIQTDKLLSNVNHRLYRQSRVYTLKVDIDADLPDGGYIDVYALQDSWMNMKAYQFAYDTFENNSKEEKEFLGTTQGRWNDFRVALGLSVTNFEAEGLSDTGLTRYVGGEYELSEVTNAGGNARTFRWLDSDATSYNIISEYDRTGNTDAGPTNPITQVAYDGLEDEVDDGQIEHLSDDGNLPPYDANAIERQVLMKVARLFIDPTGTSKLSTGYFSAPCGLVYLTSSMNGNDLASKVSIEVKGGDYKGVAGHAMLEL